MRGRQSQRDARGRAARSTETARTAAFARAPKSRGGFRVPTAADLVYKHAMQRELIVSLSILLASCGSSKPPPAQQPAAGEACKPSKLSLSVAATDRANFGADGAGRPVQLWILLLKNDSRLQAAKFDDVMQDRAKALADDLLKVDEYTVYPNEAKPLPISAPPEAHNLAAMALFREPQGKKWFASYELNVPGPPCPPPERKINLVIDRMQIGDGQASE